MHTYEYYDLSISEYEEYFISNVPSLEQLEDIPNPYPCLRSSRFSTLWSYTSKIYHLFEQLKEPRDDLSASEQTYLMENYLTHVFETFHYIDGQTNEDDKDLFYIFTFPFLSKLGCSLYNSNELQDEVFFSVLPRTSFIGAFVIHSYSMAFNDERGLEFVMRDVFGDGFTPFLRNIRGLIEFITNFFDDQVEDSSQESVRGSDVAQIQHMDDEPDNLDRILINSFDDHVEDDEPYNLNRILLNNENGNFPMLKRCTSCYEEHIQEYVVTSCRHTACKACALQWLRDHQTCWYCRQVVSEHSPVYCYHGNPSCKEEDMIGHVI